MAITIRNKLAPSEYYPDSQCDIEKDAKGEVIKRTPKHDGAAFMLRPLTEMELLDARAEMKFGEGTVTMTGAAARVLLGRGVVGWRGVRDEAGADLQFNPSYLESLTKDDVVDLAWEILRRSSLTEDERKNS